MADTCYLCEMGRKTALAAGRAAGEGFGTCHECSVHACPKHGERLAQYFRCADCIAADSATVALTVTVSDDDDAAEAVTGEAPVLSVAAAGVRAEADVNRMAAAVRWLHAQAQRGEPLDLARAARDEDVLAPGLALGWESGQGDPLRRAAIARAELLELLARELLTASSVDASAGNGALGIAAVAIAYAVRGESDLETSPLAIAGGLRLAAAPAVLAHAYARANYLFW